MNVEAIELSIEHAKKAVNKMHSLERLLKNRDFKAVIGEGYFKDAAIEMVAAKALPNTQSEAMQAQIIKDIDAIGSLQKYLNLVNQFGRQAEKAIVDHEEELTEMLKGEE